MECNVKYNEYSKAIRWLLLKKEVQGVQICVDFKIETMKFYDVDSISYVFNKE